MKIALVTDAWTPQVNGVVRTLQTTIQHLEAKGHEVKVISPDLFGSVPCPTYPEIRLAITPWKVAGLLKEYQPDTVHIATEGPLGIAARLAMKRFRWQYTTSYHTDFPAYVHARFGVPESWTYRFLRWFHGDAARTLVTTAAMRDHLKRNGFRQPLVVWSRGVDTTQFHPAEVAQPAARPIWLSVGRVSVEKGLEDFLKLDLPGTKMVVGDGPQRKDLERRYPDAVFVGAKHGAELAACYQGADVFVFPSRTDTFGLVQIEAMACGTPVAAYADTLTADVITEGETGVVRANLEAACRLALTVDRAECAERAARRYSWEAVTQKFMIALVPIRK